MDFRLDNLPKYIWLNDGEFLKGYVGEDVNLTKGLPNGILDKKYTGIGATTCELKVDRHSILVFPFRSLAWEKANMKNEHVVMYVGTKPNNKSTTENEIQTFIKEHDDQYIKLCVVADSVGKAVKAIEKAGMNAYDDFFLVLDEVELLQMQSGFRSSLPLCFDYFKEFKEKCLVSATLLDFSDEELKLEKYIVHRQCEKLKLTISQFDTHEPHKHLADSISKFLSKSPEAHKFFIGVNSNDAINEMIEVFEFHGLSHGDVQILASDNSDAAYYNGYFSKDGIKKAQLPAKITLATCAYWSGLDVKEDCVSIALSLPTEDHHSFSCENIIQFLGRVREPNERHLHFVYGKNPELPERVEVDKDEQLIVFKKILKFTSSSKISDKYTRQIHQSLGKGNSVYYLDRNNQLKISYLLTDLEKYEQQKREDYKDINNLISRLEDYFQIKMRTVKTADDFSDLFNVDSEKTYKIYTSNLADLSDDRLVKHLFNERAPIRRLAAFWHLFGRKFIGEKEAGKLVDLLANENQYRYIFLLSNVILDLLTLFSRHYKIYVSFTKELNNSRNNKKSLYSVKVVDIINRSYIDHLPSFENASKPTKQAVCKKMLELVYGLEKLEKNSAVKVPDDDLLNIPFRTIANAAFKRNLYEIRDEPKGKSLDKWKEPKINDLLDFRFDIKSSERKK
jgi:hypothetical protein